MTVIAVCGVSGAGKTYLITRLCEDPSFVRIPSVTTRQPRDGEVDGVDKVFMTVDQFEQAEGAGELLCPATNFGHRYGHDRRAIEACTTTPIIEITEDSIGTLREGLSGVLAIRIVPGDEAAAHATVQDRTSDGTSTSARLAEVARSGLSPDIDARFTNRREPRSAEEFGALVKQLMAGAGGIPG